jgi:hypothetical protein
MKSQLFLLLFLFFYIYPIPVNLQNKVNKSSEFNNEGTQIFSILKNSPKSIVYPDTIKDLKLDIVFKNSKLVPEFGIEFLPLYLTIFKNKSYNTIVNMNHFVKQLKDVKLGIGNKLLNSTNYILGASIIYPIYQQNDIAFNKNLIKEIYNKLNNKLIDNIQQEIMSLKIDYFLSKNKSIKKKIKDKQLEVNKLFDKLGIEELIKKYKKEYWNSTYINLGYGLLFHYNMNDKFKGFNAKILEIVIIYQSGFGIGKNILCSQLIRYHRSKQIINNIYNGFNLTFKKDKNNIFVEVFNLYNINNNNIIEYNINLGINLFIKKQLICLGVRFNFNTKGLEGIIPMYNFNFKF